MAQAKIGPEGGYMDEVLYSSIINGLAFIGIAIFLSYQLYRKISLKYQRLIIKIIKTLSPTTFVFLVFEPIGLIVYLQQNVNYISNETVKLLIVSWFFCFYLTSAPLWLIENK